MNFLTLNKKDDTIPSTQRWIYRLLFLRLLFFIITFAITVYVLENKVEEGILNKITNFTIAKYLNITPGNPFELVPELSGQLFGGNILIFIAIYVQYYSLENKKVAGFWIAWVFDLLFVASYPFFPIMPLITLLLRLTPAIKKTFSKQDHEDGLLDTDF